MTSTTRTGHPRADYAATLTHLTGTLIPDAPGMQLDATTLAGIYRIKARHLGENTTDRLNIATAAIQSYDAAANALLASGRMLDDERPELALAFATAAMSMAAAAEKAATAATL